MATTENIAVDGDTNEIVIHELRVHDQELAEYLNEFDPDTQDDALERVLRVGASVLRLSDTSKEVEYVDRRFTEMEAEFEDEMETLRDELTDRFDEEDGELAKILDSNLGEDGKLSDILDDTFGEDGEMKARMEEVVGEDGEKIQDALDPEQEGTPTNRLKKNLIQEIEKVKQILNEQQGRDKVRGETRLKGYDFEDRVERILSDVVHQTSNRVEETTEERGSKGKSKKGDFLVTLDESGQRIVVEAKNGEFNGTVESEMNEAIENREADYGIFVARSLEFLPRTKFGWFSEVDQQYVVVALSDNEDDEIDGRFLKFAYHWARTRALLSSVDVGEDIDPETVKEELNGMEESIKRFKQIRTECTDLTNSVNKIEEILTDIENEVHSRISNLEDELHDTPE